MNDTPCAITLTAGSIRAIAMPLLGGRIISLTANGEELFWRNPALLDAELRPRVARAAPRQCASFADWQNWGGDKSWVAPQGWERDDQWHGPPDPTFDAGPFRVTTQSDRSIGMRSRHDPATGLRMSRAVTVHDHGMRVTTTIRNESDTTQRWAAWEVAQIPVHHADRGCPSAGVHAYTTPGVRPLTLMRLAGTILATVRGELTAVPFGDATGKLGFPGSTGTLEVHHAESPGLRLTFRVLPGAPYPDESPAQLWVQTLATAPLAGLDGFIPDANLVELEATSPLADLEPGASTSLTCDWTVIDAVTSR